MLPFFKRVFSISCKIRLRYSLERVSQGLPKISQKLEKKVRTNIGIVGPFPAWMCKHATGNALQYVDGSRLRKPETMLSESSRRAVAACRPVHDVIRAPLGVRVRGLGLAKLAKFC